jgi:hypothetical protein
VIFGLPGGGVDDQVFSLSAASESDGPRQGCTFLSPVSNRDADTGIAKYLGKRRVVVEAPLACD